MPEPISDADIERAYREALASAKRHAGDRGQEYAEALHDAATDGVMAALAKYDPAKCQHGFPAFCGKVVATRIRRAQRRLADQYHNRPTVGAMPEEFPGKDLPAAGNVPMSADLNDLPPELRDAVRLVFVDGYSQRDAGLLLGVSHTEVRNRLTDAAYALAEDGAAAPERRRGEKRIRGGVGH